MMFEMLKLLRIPGFRYAASLAYVAMLSAVAAGLEMIGMLAAVRIFETLVSDDASTTVALVIFNPSVRVATLLGLAAMAASALMQVESGRATAHLSTSYLACLRFEILLAVRRASSHVHTKQAAGHVQELVSSVSYQASLLPMRFATMLTAALATGVLISVAFVVEPLAAAVLVLAGGVLTLALLPISRLSARSIARHTELQTTLGRSVATWSARQRDFRSFGVEDVALEQQSVIVRETSDELFRVRAITHAGVAVYRSLTVAALITLIAVATQTNAVDPLDATLVLVITLRALSYAQQFNSARQIALEAAGPARTLLDEIDELRRSGGAAGQHHPSGFDSLSFEHAYLGDATDGAVLHDLNLEVERGDAVGIVGRSGGGKSTMARAMAGLEDAVGGEVKINGVSIRDVAPTEWAKICAFTPQNPMLIPGTLADNVRFYREHLSADAIGSALDLVGLDELPLTLSIEPGASNGGLSGGQIQRIALARALAGAPELLVLDEPTSALDAESEQLISQALRSLAGRLTMVVVTHRPAPLQLCTRFLAVGDSTVRELDSLDAAIALGRDDAGAADDR